MKRIFPALIIMLIVWSFTAFLVDKMFLPQPYLVIIKLFDLILKGTLGIHILISLLRVAAALLISFIPAFILGIIAGRSEKADNLISPSIYILFPIPKVALLPVILLFLGLGNASKIFFVALIIFFQFYLNIRDETHSLNQRYFDSLTTLGGRKRDELRHILIPALLPRLFSTLRMTFGTAIAVLFLAETFATREGIGWFIMDSWSRLAYIEMYAGIMALSLAALVLFILIDYLELKFCRWQ